MELGHELLLAIGEDPQRSGIKDTPKRWAAWWREFIEYDSGKTDVTFDSTSFNHMVVISGIRVWSLCEHHLLPFWCNLSIAYVPTHKVLGLSKFARIAHGFAHRLQIQERLVCEIADEIEACTDSADVAVLAEGEHLCMSSRGIRTPGLMTSFATRGSFEHDATLRAEFLGLAGR